MNGYAVAHLDDIDEQDARCPYRPVRHHFGITAFGATAWTAREAGDRIINKHDESDPDANEELYLVLRGRAVFELDGERVDAPTGTLVFARPRREANRVRRGARYDDPRARRHAGEGLRARRVGALGSARRSLRGGEYAEVADRLRPLVEAHPQSALLFYNLACLESLTGIMNDCVMCDLDKLRGADVYIENDYCVYASTRDPRDPPDVLPGSGIIIPIAHRASPFDFTAEEWTATHELLVQAKEAQDERLAPDGYLLSWSCFPATDDAVRDMHAHLHVVPRFDDEPFWDRGGRTAIKEPENRRPDPSRPGSGRARLFGRRTGR